MLETCKLTIAIAKNTWWEILFLIIVLAMLAYFNLYELIVNLNFIFLRSKILRRKAKMLQLGG